MADLPKDNESTLNPQRAEETHKPARGAAGGRHVAESQAEVQRRGDHSGDAGADRRQDREASGEALRRQLASPVIESVTTMVCVTCGAEQFFEGNVPTSLKCQRCGSMVFRAFDTPTRRDEATIAHLEEEARSLQYGDESPQTAPEEVRDLEMK
jgi:DNA-directed RNA polymerase subunit RPC12/RpoP